MGCISTTPAPHPPPPAEVGLLLVSEHQFPLTQKGPCVRTEWTRPPWPASRSPAAASLELRARASPSQGAKRAQQEHLNLEGPFVREKANHDKVWHRAGLKLQTSRALIIHRRFRTHPRTAEGSQERGGGPLSSPGPLAPLQCTLTNRLSRCWVGVSKGFAEGH